MTATATAKRSTKSQEPRTKEDPFLSGTWSSAKIAGLAAFSFGAWIQVRDQPHKGRRFWRYECTREGIGSDRGSITGEVSVREAAHYAGEELEKALRDVGELTAAAVVGAWAEEQLDEEAIATGAWGDRLAHPTPEVDARHDSADAVEVLRPDEGKEESIPLGKIDPSPYQDRRDFDAGELAQLAATLEAHGLLQPIVVRPKGDRFEIVAGERRTRAAKHLGWSTIRATVRALSDKQAAELVLVENLSRKDLGPIEEARGYKRLVDLGHKQEAIAERVGVSPSQVAHRLRLLELPAKWLTKVEKGELTPSHGRTLVTWSGVKALWPQMEKELLDRMRWQPDMSLAEWERTVLSAARQHTEEVAGETYTNAGRVKWKLDTTDLVMVDVPGWNGGKPETRVVRTKEVEKRRQAAIGEASKKGDAKAKGKGAGGSGPGLKLTPKQQAEHDARRKKELAEQLVRRINLWREGWLLELCRNWPGWKLEANRQKVADMGVRFALWAASDGHDAGDRGDLLDGVLSEGKRKTNRFGFVEYTSLQAGDGTHVAGRFLQACLQSEDGLAVPPDIVEAIAGELQLDLAKAWREQRAGERTEEFYDLHTKDQLLELALKHWKIQVTDKMGKGELIERLCPGGADYLATATLPKSIALVKPAKGGK